MFNRITKYLTLLAGRLPLNERDKERRIEFLLSKMKYFEGSCIVVANYAPKALKAYMQHLDKLFGGGRVVTYSLRVGKYVSSMDNWSSVYSLRRHEDFSNLNHSELTEVRKTILREFFSHGDRYKYIDYTE